MNIHFVLQFREAPFRKEYINYFTTKRNEKKEKKEKYHDIKIVQDVESCLRLTCLPNYKRFIIVDEMFSLENKCCIGQISISGILNSGTCKVAFLSSIF